MRKRAAFVTIGQSPRPDILGEMASLSPAFVRRLDVVELGALDGLERAEIDELAPSGNEPRLVSRLSDGSEVVLRESSVHERVRALVTDLDRERLDLVVLLCTGRFDGLRSRNLLLQAQPLVDHAVQGLTASGGRVGVLVPNAVQAAARAELTLVSHASPYSGDRFDDAVDELAEADLLVLHCMGYTLRHKHRVAERAGKPVLLAREVVATAAAWMLG